MRTIEQLATLKKKALQGYSLLAQALPLLVDDLQYCNLSDRGHLQLTFTREQVTAEWQFIDNIESTTFRAMNRHQFTVTRS